MAAMLISESTQGRKRSIIDNKHLIEGAGLDHALWSRVTGLGVRIIQIEICADRSGVISERRLSLR